ncbi:ice-binding family protein [Cryobacterium sp. PH29-G1]|uniref:ice-binding family protein n=1 Tax=Cryobacterium sp. PH29-G1 TaxID=3046211 RepID=UPI0024B983D6|nr:ice-binding family protein [Cryobacterium sp. PH29-G1]MDJ0348175.1 ice-binding family protein [Cryobacterium sp. PH29-G1]
MITFQQPSTSRKRLLAAALALAVVGIGSIGFGTTAVADPIPQAPVDLGVAGTFAILSQTGVTDVPTSAVTGNVGVSPTSGAATLLTCPEVTGTIYSVDAAGPACKVTDATLLTTAVGDMRTAYTDAAGRTNPDFINLGAGEIGGLTLKPGLYKWSTDVSISNDVKLVGGPNDVFIFQISGDITEAAAKNVTLAGGVQAKNVFWQTAGSVSVGTTAHFEGSVLSKTLIALKTGASINGRLLAQTAVTLQSNTVTEPAL